MLEGRAYIIIFKLRITIAIRHLHQYRANCNWTATQQLLWLTLIIDYHCRPNASPNHVLLNRDRDLRGWNICQGRLEHFSFKYWQDHRKIFIWTHMCDSPLTSPRRLGCKCSCSKGSLFALGKKLQRSRRSSCGCLEIERPPIHLSRWRFLEGSGRFTRQGWHNCGHRRASHYIAAFNRSKGTRSW